MERIPIRLRRSQRKLSLAALAAFSAATGVWAKESTVPRSAFRRYFWGARQAYEDRDFKKARQLLRTYRRMGSPPDKLLATAGCDTKWEVSLFETALQDAQACSKGRSTIRYWTDVELAKKSVLEALRTGDASSLESYVDCAPTDVVQQSTVCGARLYRKPNDLERLAKALQKVPEILQHPNWREFPLKAEEPQRVRWILHTYSDKWMPCGLPGSPIVSLRQDPTGEIRIAGFAASCLES